MVLATFNHITTEKQARVRDALLTEFSRHSLAEAQVARIVTDAGIARGAFYKYFSDLQDAYEYVFGYVMQQIHESMPETPNRSNQDAYVAAIRHFVGRVDQQGFRRIVEMHYRYNEGIVGSQATQLVGGDDGPKKWAMTVLYHQTVRDVILDPDTIDARLAQLKGALG